MIKLALGVILCLQPEAFYSNSSESRFMDIKLHKQATTTRRSVLRSRQRISDSELARQYGVAVATIHPVLAVP
tara:strand:- start:3064 stop:3282 length:219 start_codon:yes stop_codon:yes gene_type:complete